MKDNTLCNAVEALQKSEERYRVLVNNLPVGVCQATPGPEGKFLMANPALVEMLGFDTEEELKAIRIQEIYRNPHDRAKYSNRLIEEEMVRGAELLLKKKDGTPILCYDTAITVRDEGGQVAYFDCIIEDITQRKKAEEALHISEERYRGIMEAIEEGYYECDLNGCITFCNDAVEKLIGYKKEELMGLNYQVLYKEPDKVFRTFNSVFESGKPNKGFSLEMIRKDGEVIFGELSVSSITDKDGRIIGFRGVGRDITERRVFEEKLQFLSLHDQLTGLYNRAYFEEELQRIKGGRDYPVTIISIDLDGLKIINDSLGHKQGDILLQACARVLRKPLRTSDVLARVGGDEFVIALPHTDEESGQNILKRIQAAVVEYNQKEAVVPLVLSLGAATCNDSSESLEETFKKADDMMYASKYAKVSSVRREFVGALLDLIEKDPEKGGRIAKVFPGLVLGAEFMDK